MTRELMDYITKTLEKQIDDKKIPFDLVYKCLNGFQQGEYPPEIVYFCRWVEYAAKLQDEARQR